MKNPKGFMGLQQANQYTHYRGEGRRKNERDRKSIRKYNGQKLQI